MGSRKGWAEDRPSTGWRGAAWHMRAHACPCPVRGSPGLAWETQRRHARVGEPRAPPHGPPRTHGEQEAPVLLDGPDAAHEADGHDQGAGDDEQIGGRQGREGGGQGGEVPLRGGQPDADPQDAAASQLGPPGQGEGRSGAICTPCTPGRQAKVPPEPRGSQGGVQGTAARPLTSQGRAPPCLVPPPRLVPTSTRPCQ